MIDHYASWVDLGGKLLPGESSSTGPILITGHIKTSKCGKVVWGAAGQLVRVSDVWLLRWGRRRLLRG